MTHDPEDHNIPELYDRIEGRVTSPDPATIRAEATRRGAARKRVLTAAGAFVAVVALVGGVYTFTGDETTTTETASDDAPAAGEPNESTFEFSDSVADDSAALEVGNDPDVVDVQILAIEGEPIGDVVMNVGNAPTRLRLHNAGTSEYETDVLEVIGPCRADAYAIEWKLDATNSFEIVRTMERNALVEKERESVCDSPSVDYLFAPGQTLAVSFSEVIPGRVSMQSSGVPAWGLTATLQEVAPLVAVPIAECVNESTISVHGSRWRAWNLPPEWAGRDLVYVTAPIGGDTLVATDSDGLTALFGRDNGEPRSTLCLAFDHEQPTAQSSVPTTVAAPKPTTTTEPPTTTTLVEDSPSLPELQGSEFNEALNILFEMELRTSRIDEPSADVEPGHVIRTEPNAGVSVEPRDMVTIVVSIGDTKVAVPDVESILSDAAAQRLRAEGFEVVIELESVEDPGLVNRVLSQSPPPNANREPGSTVTIIVGKEAID